MKTSLLAPCCALWFAASAMAGTLQVSVTDLEGKPAADVVVLLVSSAAATTTHAAKPAPAAGAAPVLIVQENSRFNPFLTVVPVASTLRFTNRDNYDHHVRSTPSGPLGSTAPAASFELRLDAAAGASPAGNDEARPQRKRSGATSGEVKLDQAGPIGLGCHLHSSMRGQVYVSPTPWYAKTDANGIARLDNAPEGAAELTLWHPDQVQDQPPLRVQLGAAPAPATVRLNFTPRRRRG
jgi:plastocyanin